MTQDNTQKKPISQPSQQLPPPQPQNLINQYSQSLPFQPNPQQYDNQIQKPIVNVNVNPNQKSKEQKQSPQNQQQHSSLSSCSEQSNSKDNEPQRKKKKHHRKKKHHHKKRKQHSPQYYEAKKQEKIFKKRENNWNEHFINDVIPDMMTTGKKKPTVNSRRLFSRQYNSSNGNGNQNFSKQPHNYTTSIGKKPATSNDRHNRLPDIADKKNKIVNQKGNSNNNDPNDDGQQYIAAKVATAEKGAKKSFKQKRNSQSELVSNGNIEDNIAPVVNVNVKNFNSSSDQKKVQTQKHNPPKKQSAVLSSQKPQQKRKQPLKPNNNKQTAFPPKDMSPWDQNPNKKKSQRQILYREYFQKVQYSFQTKKFPQFYRNLLQKFLPLIQNKGIRDLFDRQLEKISQGKSMINKCIQAIKNREKQLQKVKNLLSDQQKLAVTVTNTTTNQTSPQQPIISKQLKTHLHEKYYQIFDDYRTATLLCIEEILKWKQNWQNTYEQVFQKPITFDFLYQYQNYLQTIYHSTDGIIPQNLLSSSHGDKTVQPQQQNISRDPFLITLLDISTENKEVALKIRACELLLLEEEYNNNTNSNQQVA